MLSHDGWKGTVDALNYPLGAPRQFVQKDEHRFVYRGLRAKHIRFWRLARISPLRQYGAVMAIRHARGSGPSPRHYEPIHRIDTRPHAVFFSLLALIMLLPASNTPTHAVTIDLPMPGLPLYAELSPPRDLVIVTESDQILWNAQPISLTELEENLRWRLRQPERRQIVFDPQGGAGYDLSLKVLALIKSTGNAGPEFCFGNLSRYGRFGTEDRQGTNFDTQGGLPCGSYVPPPPPLIPAVHPPA